MPNQEPLSAAEIAEMKRICEGPGEMGYSFTAFATEARDFIPRALAMIEGLQDGLARCIQCQALFPHEPRYFASEGALVCNRCMLIKSVQAERDQLRAEVERLKADERRLLWLIQHTLTWELLGPAWSGQPEEDRYRVWREEIDAAIHKESKP